MWRTQFGNRTLEGLKAVVFAKALLSLLNETFAEELDGYESSIEYFDNLSIQGDKGAESAVGRVKSHYTLINGPRLFASVSVLLAKKSDCWNIKLYGSNRSKAEKLLTEDRRVDTDVVKVCD
jgi:hypothetical protein